MSAVKIPISALVGRRVAALHKLTVVNIAEATRDNPAYADGFVEFEDGLVVKLEGKMEVYPLTPANLPSGCERLFVTSEAHGSAWDVVDVGCDAWYLSFCLLLRANMVLGLKHFGHSTISIVEPCAEAFDRLEVPSWLHGPLPQLPPDYIMDWWEGPCGAYATEAEMEA